MTDPYVWDPDPTGDGLAAIVATNRRSLGLPAHAPGTDAVACVCGQPWDATAGRCAAEQEEAKVEGREIVEPQGETVAQGGAVVDLMAALRESMAAAKRSRSEEEAGG